MCGLKMSVTGEPKKGIYGLDPSKYPARMGKAWLDEEVIKMLIAVKKKKTVAEIASVHERTEGGIVSKLRALAADYHFNDGKSIDEIVSITGLSPDSVEEAIQRRKYREEMLSAPKKKASILVALTASAEKEPTMKEVMAILTDIQKKMGYILERIQ